MKGAPGSHLPEHSAGTRDLLEAPSLCQLARRSKSGLGPYGGPMWRHTAEHFETGVKDTSLLHPTKTSNSLKKRKK